VGLRSEIEGRKRNLRMSGKRCETITVLALAGMSQSCD
jgi:hypothetical protein